MFLENLDNLEKIASNTGFSIFCLENPEITPIKNAIYIEKNSKNQITIDQVREIIDLCKTRQTKDFFIIIKSADTMNEKAQNAFLKLLEEPAENYHFVLLVKNLSGLLETVISRGEIYFKKTEFNLGSLSETDEDIRFFAKRMLTATESDLIRLMNDIVSHKEYKKKENARPYTLKILELAIEMCYKSYLKTHNLKFIIKLKKLLNLQQNIKNNGHIKLHLVADLL